MKRFKNIFLLLCVFVATDVMAQCDFEMYDPSPNPGNPLQLGFSHSSSTALNVLWEFGDDSTGTFQSGTHTYASAGVYTVCLTIDNCPKVCKTIVVGDVEVNCDFEMYNPSPNPGNPLQLGFSHSSKTALNVLWSFGDDSTATFQGGTHTYASAGRYTVCLTIDTCPEICQNIIVGDVSAIDGLDAVNFAIYPNPGNDKFSIDFHLNLPEKLTLKVLSSTGAVVLEKEIDGFTGANVSNINLEGLSKGVYSVQVVGENTKLQKALFKL